MMRLDKHQWYGISSIFYLILGGLLGAAMGRGIELPALAFIPYAILTVLINNFLTKKVGFKSRLK